MANDMKIELIFPLKNIEFAGKDILMRLTIMRGKNNRLKNALEQIIFLI